MSKPKPLGLHAPPIWAEPEPGNRRPKLTREQISETALAIADAEGIEAVSMRRIADELGVATMTLYYYVRTKDDLLALMDDALTGEMVIPGKLPGHWREAIAAIARASRAVFVRHPWALAWREGSRIGPNGLTHMEQSLAAVASAPQDARGKLELISAVDDYVFGHALRLRDPLATSSDATSVRAIDEFISAQLATGAYPHLALIVGRDRPVAAFMRFASAMTDEARFERGLAALLDGFDTPRPRWNPHGAAGVDVGVGPGPGPGPGTGPGTGTRASGSARTPNERAGEAGSDRTADDVVGGSRGGTRGEPTADRRGERGAGAAARPPRRRSRAQRRR